MSTRGWTPTLRPARTAGLLPLLTTTILAACGEEPTRPVPRDPLPAVARVEVAAEATELPVGAGTQLVATPLAADGTPLPGRAVTWASSDTSRVTVSGTGFVTARAPGSATITALSGERVGRRTISVAPLEVAEVRISPRDFVLEAGTSRALVAEALAADGTPIPGRAAVWHASDPAVLSVDASGRITARREGIVVVNAEIDGKMGWARVIVPPDLSGEWRLAVYDLHGGGVHCRIEGVTATLSREGMEVAGEAHPADDGGVRVGCDIIGGEPPFVTPMPPDGPLAGSLSPAVAAAHLDLALAFEFDRWLLRGELIGGAVTGTAWLSEEIAGRTVTREGRFVMTRSQNGE